MRWKVMESGDLISHSSNLRNVTRVIGAVPSTHLPVQWGSYIVLQASGPSIKLRHHRCQFSWYRKLVHHPLRYAMTLVVRSDTGADVEFQAENPW